MCVVCKFGGTSLGGKEQLKLVKEIIGLSNKREVVVVSAPGARFSGDKKVTDLLICLATIQKSYQALCGYKKKAENLLLTVNMPNFIGTTKGIRAFKGAKYAETVDKPNNGRIYNGTKDGGAHAEGAIKDTIKDRDSREAHRQRFEELFSEVSSRFLNFANECPKIDIPALLKKVKKQIIQKNSYDFTVSRGEYIIAVLTASATARPFVDAADLIAFDPSGCVNLAKTRQLFKKAKEIYPTFVMPGFYGGCYDDSLNDCFNNYDRGYGSYGCDYGCYCFRHGHRRKIKVFPRGGSDTAGAIAAYCLNASAYENWTDVDGFMTADPRHNPAARTINRLSYKEARIMSLGGATVLTAPAIDYAEKGDIPIIIKNTFNPSFDGTVISRAEDSNYSETVYK